MKSNNINKKKYHIEKAVKKKGAVKNTVKDAISKGEIDIASEVMKTDEDNSASVSAAILTSDVVVRSTLKAPSRIYRINKKTIQAAHFTGHVAVKTGKISKKAVIKLKSHGIESLSKTIAANYINSDEVRESKNNGHSGNNKTQNNEWKYDTSSEKREVVKREERLKRNKAATKKEADIMAKKMGISVASGKDRKPLNTFQGENFTEISPSLKRAISSEKTIRDDGPAEHEKQRHKKDKKGNKVNKGNGKNRSHDSVKRFAKQYAISSLTGGASKEGSAAKKIVYYQAALIKKLAVTIVRTIVMVIGAAAPILIVPITIILAATLVLDIPPFSWMTTNSLASEQIVITYEDRMREFGIEVDSLNPDDNTVIHYNVDTNELRKDAMLLYMAKKNVCSINELSEEDCRVYGDILSGLLECNMNINGYVEIQDGSLISGGEGGKYLQNTSKSYSNNIHSGDNGVFVEDSCNEHGVVGELSSDGKAIHTTGTFYFIPCEVSRYSSIPIGTCLQVANNTDRTPYILMVVGKIEDEAKDNQNLYLCGDLRLFDDRETPKFYNINTTAYGKLSFFSSNWYTSSSIGYTTDDEVEYTGLLDYMSSINSEDRYYNIIYRSPGALAEEFALSPEEIENIFGKYYDFDTLNDEELEELKAAGIYVPKKEIYILDTGMDAYAKNNFTADEQERLKELIQYKEDNETIFNEYFEKMIGSVYAEKITDDIMKGVGTESDSIARYLADVYISNGIYIPGNASVLAKYIDDNGWTIEETNYNNLKTGDLIFMSSDTGTYKNITHVVVKVDGGYMTIWDGKVTIEKSLPYNNGLQYSTVVMCGRIQ